MEELNPLREATILATSAWRRDFEHDPKLQDQVHGLEAPKFLESLKTEMAGLRGVLHPDHALDVSDDLRTVTVVEGHNRRPLARCYVNIASIGRLYFQYHEGNSPDDDSKSEARLIRMGKDEYACIGDRLSSGS